ncbi:hypothetical protein GCM10025787_58570 [Saccharopolyspora rosea]
MQRRVQVVDGDLVLDSDRLTGVVEQNHLFHGRYLLAELGAAAHGAAVDATTLGVRTSGRIGRQAVPAAPKRPVGLVHPAEWSTPIVARRWRNATGCSLNVADA